MSNRQPTLFKDLRPERFDTPSILKKVTTASRQLAELKGVAATIPNQNILINTLGMQEAKDSSEIENIFTTHDEVFRDDAFPDSGSNLAAKEVSRYHRALSVGNLALQLRGIITVNDIINIQGRLVDNNAGIRKLPGTVIKDGAGKTVYTPPQDYNVVVAQLSRLEYFINDDSVFDADPLVKMALMHHQFESIHPFYDGNGRTGRILNVLYLVREGLLDFPALYMSRYIVRTKDTYYQLLQGVHIKDAWEDWVLYMLSAVEDSAREAVGTVNAIKSALKDVKDKIQNQHKFYSRDLVDSLFLHPYARIAAVERDVGVTRLTATKYLDTLAEDGILLKRKVGNKNYYVNTVLYRILVGTEYPSEDVNG